MQHVRLEESKKIAFVMLSRPERHNAFHPEMIAELTELFLRLEKREDLNAVVLRGSGASFSAGGDLEWMKSMIGFSREENLQDAGRLFDMFMAMTECSLPLIGQVHGNVMGGGLGLVAVCDIVMAEKDTKFCFSEAKIGIAPAVISPFVLRKVPQGFAREVMLSAQVFTAQHAQQMGLVHHIGTQAGMDTQVDKILNSFEECAGGAVREAKRLMNFIASKELAQCRARSTQVIAERRISAEGQEGLKAFLEKRKPSWRS